MNAAIVMPALNEAATIESLFHDIQTSVSLPIWLVDDCSTDATGDLASNMDVRVIRLPASLGAWERLKLACGKQRAGALTS